MIINSFNNDFEEWLKQVDTELYENCKTVSIVNNTKTYIKTIIKNKRELLLSNVCTIKRDLYNLEQKFINENE